MGNEELYTPLGKQCDGHVTCVLRRECAEWFASFALGASPKTSDTLGPWLVRDFDIKLCFSSNKIVQKCSLNIHKTFFHKNFARKKVP